MSDVNTSVELNLHASELEENALLGIETGDLTAVLEEASLMEMDGSMQMEDPASKLSAAADAVEGEVEPVEKPVDSVASEAGYVEEGAAETVGGEFPTSVKEVGALETTGETPTVAEGTPTTGEVAPESNVERGESMEIDAEVDTKVAIQTDQAALAQLPECEVRLRQLSPIRLPSPEKGDPTLRQQSRGPAEWGRRKENWRLCGRANAFVQNETDDRIEREVCRSRRNQCPLCPIPIDSANLGRLRIHVRSHFVVWFCSCGLAHSFTKDNVLSHQREQIVAEPDSECRRRLIFACDEASYGEMLRKTTFRDPTVAFPRPRPEGQAALDLYNKFRKTKVTAKSPDLKPATKSTKEVESPSQTKARVERKVVTTPQVKVTIGNPKKTVSSTSGKGRATPSTDTFARGFPQDVRYLTGDLKTPPMVSYCSSDAPPTKWQVPKKTTAKDETSAANKPLPSSPATRMDTVDAPDVPTTSRTLTVAESNTATCHQDARSRSAVGPIRGPLLASRLAPYQPMDEKDRQHRKQLREVEEGLIRLRRFLEESGMLTDEVEHYMDSVVQLTRRR